MREQTAGNKNAEKIQQVLSDQLFPEVNHVSDVKQVLEYIENVAQPVSEEQLRAAILLLTLGNNERLHPQNPYLWIVERLIGVNEKSKDYAIWKRAVAPVTVYLDTLQELIPKPPRPVVVAPGKGDK